MNEARSALFEVRDLEVRFNAVRALKGVSLQVNEGEVVALLGANGAGKSTTLRTISGLSRLSSGDILFSGKTIANLPSTRIVRLGIAHCPEGRRLFGGLTVAENLRLGSCTRSDAEGVAVDTERMFTLFPILRER